MMEFDIRIQNSFLVNLNVFFYSLILKKFDLLQRLGRDNQLSGSKSILMLLCGDYCGFWLSGDDAIGGGSLLAMGDAACS